MSMSVVNLVDRRMTRSDDGHRDYHVTWLLKATNSGDGPGLAMIASGLPTVGTAWAYGNDNDPYALCFPNLRVQPKSSSVQKPEREFYWLADQLFSTRPMPRCQTTSVTDPLSEPQKVSGSSTRFAKKARLDRNGDRIEASNHEDLTGIEQDASRATVVIEQNVASLGLSTFSAMLDTINDATLWGVPARRVKFSTVSWERKQYVTCTYYYTRRFEFEVRYKADDTFDITDAVDCGFKVLRGHWDEAGDWITDVDADIDNLNDFVLRVDKTFNPTPVKILLDGAGKPLTNPATPFILDPIELYTESNFLTLGIPTTL